MKIRFLVALLATVVACTGSGDPTGPSPITPPGGEPITPPLPPPPPPVRSIVFKVYNVLSTGNTVYGPDTAMVTIQSGSFKDSVLVRGQASINFPTITPDTVLIALPGNSQYPMIIATVPKAIFDSWKNTVVIDRAPRTWTIRKGLYAGKSAVTDLIRPYKRTPQPDNTSFYRRVGNDSMGYSYPQLGWNPASFPVKIWIDADSSFTLTGIRPNASDSTNLDSKLAELSNLLGWKPFTVVSRASGFGTIRAVLLNSNREQSVVFNDSGFELFGGMLYSTVPSRFRYAIKHEGIHMLEFGHTCEWAGLMPTGCIGRPNTVDETYLDVAYIEAWYAMSQTRRETGAQIHWGENLNGTLLEINPKGKIDPVVYGK